jgi:electron transfer flavoprotein alpha subunit
VRTKAGLAVVEELAAAMGATLGCTMPVSDDWHWFPTYIGRSGESIAPALYLALGVQGTAQHMFGLRGARCVAAVNSDPHAPIFAAADYGIVGDLHEVVPALIKAVARP